VEDSKTIGQGMAESLFLLSETERSSACRTWRCSLVVYGKDNHGTPEAGIQCTNSQIY
jgi:hypothetical protein